MKKCSKEYKIRHINTAQSIIDKANTKAKKHVSKISRADIHKVLYFEYEGFKGLLSGGLDEYDRRDADLLIVLDSLHLPDRMFDTGCTQHEKQRLIYFPIRDMSIPLKTELKYVLEVIHEYIKTGKHVHVQCIGGHGRTGLILACYVGVYTTTSTPIKFVREHYCADAVESKSQMKYIGEYTGKPENIVDTKYNQRLYEYFSKDAKRNETTAASIYSNFAHNYAGDNRAYQSKLKEMLNRESAERLYCPCCNDILIETDLDNEYFCENCAKTY